MLAVSQIAEHTFAMNKKPTLLAIFAHPDDEAFGTGGTLSHYATSGYRVVLACATRGEAGEIADPTLANPESLGDVREAELRCSAHTMGFDEVLFLDYCDSGMDGTDMNKDRTAYINAPDEEVVRKLVEIIRDVKPDVVLTFEPYGIYGHPDHMAIHRHAVAAFHAAADVKQFPAARPRLAIRPFVLHRRSAFLFRGDGKTAGRTGSIQGFQRLAGRSNSCRYGHFTAYSSQMGCPVMPCHPVR